MFIGLIHCWFWLFMGFIDAKKNITCLKMRHCQDRIVRTQNDRAGWSQRKPSTGKMRGTSHLDTEESSTRTVQHDAAANRKQSLIFYSTACGQLAPVFDIFLKTAYFSLAK